MCVWRIHLLFLLGSKHDHSPRVVYKECIRVNLLMLHAFTYQFHTWTVHIAVSTREVSTFVSVTPISLY